MSQGVGPRVVAFACVLALALAGCGTGERADDASAVAESFHAALESGDGQAACDELSEETASELEQEEQKPCDEAILELDLPKGGTVALRDVQMRSAYAGLAEGSVDFLNEGPQGWKVSAAGCRSVTPNRPYECELEG
jgi:hypothetical protein